MKDNFTAIVAILDASSSMSRLTQETIKGFNTFLAEQQALPGEAVLTLAVFSSHGNYRLVHNATPLQSVQPLTTADYNPSGWTALHDAIARTIDEVGVALAAMPEEERPSKVLFLITTDGEENSSRTFTAQDVHDRITHQTQKYSWEFVFVGANQADVVAVGQTLGVSAANSYNFTADAAGSAQLYGNLSRGVSNYRSSALGSSYTMDDPTVVSGTAQANQPAFDLASLVNDQQASVTSIQGSQTLVPTIASSIDTFSVMSLSGQDVTLTTQTLPGGIPSSVQSQSNLPLTQNVNVPQKSFDFVINDPLGVAKTNRIKK